MTLGESIKNQRIKKGMTQKQLGEAMGVGVQMISAYESGRRRPKTETLARFADALGVSLSDLLADVDYIPNEKDPQNGFISSLSFMRIRELASEYKQLEGSGANEMILFIRDQLNKAKSDIQDNALLSVFHTLSDVNKQKAISYCEGLAAQQPDYEFSDTVQKSDKQEREEVEEKEKRFTSPGGSNAE